MVGPPISVKSTDPAVPAVLGDGAGTGVFGHSIDGPGLSAESSNFDACIANCHSPTNSAVAAVNDKGGFGVRGLGRRGVVGESVDPDGIGVFGSSASGIGVHGRCSGNNHGVQGVSDIGNGVRGESRTNHGVHGESATGRGVIGISQTFYGTTGTSTSGDGVLGESTSGSGVRGGSASGIGVVGQGLKDSGVVGLHGDPRLQEIPTIQSNLAGVFGASDIGAGVMGYSRNKDSFGVIAFGGILASAVNHPLAGSFAGNVAVEGSITCQGDILLPNADCAEDFDISGEITVEPGTVMVLNEVGQLAESSQPYDRRVVGVVSGGGHYKPGIVLDRRETKGIRQPIALMGKTFCKVDARFAPIEVGDLLTTSPTPGHAMATKEHVQSFGAVIGKALRPFTEGQGSIPILIALQ